MSYLPDSSSRRRGFSLVEVVLALGLTTFCLVGLIGLFSVGIKTEHSSSDKLSATHILQGLIATRRATPDSTTNPDFPLPAIQPGMVSSSTLMLDANGSVAGSDSEARYRLRYSIDAPAAGDPRPARLHLYLTW